MTAIFNSHLVMIVIVAVVAIVGIVSVKFFGVDNPVEKVAEQVIKEETGIDVNLTPSDTKVVSTASAPSSSPSGSAQGTQQAPPPK